MMKKRNKRFPVRYYDNGRAMLNLACGNRMHPNWNNIDFSPLILLARYRRFARIFQILHVLSGERFHRVQAIDPNIIRWNLLAGIPFPDDTFDVVYHSHFLEHLDRSVVSSFFKECYRVVKPAGVLRIVVPDLEIRCRNYVETLNLMSQTTRPDPSTFARHKENIRRILEQIVRLELTAMAKQPFLIRIFERIIRGDAAKTGDIHRWMYDQYTLPELFTQAGFKDIHLESPENSRIPGWAAFQLDTHEDGSAYKRDSIYVEGIK